MLCDIYPLLISWIRILQRVDGQRSFPSLQIVHLDLRIDNFGFVVSTVPSCYSRTLGYGGLTPWHPNPPPSPYWILVNVLKKFDIIKGTTSPIMNMPTPQLHVIVTSYVRTSPDDRPSLDGAYYMVERMKIYEYPIALGDCSVSWVSSVVCWAL